jgi:hypothetical protein
MPLSLSAEELGLQVCITTPSYNLKKKSMLFVFKNLIKPVEKKKESY